MSTPGLNPALRPPGVGGAGAIGAPAPVAPPRTRPDGPSFGDVLARETSSLHFSGHALQRLQKRGIELDTPTLQRLEGAVDRAAGKGSRDAVVFVDSSAFVVSVQNRTVITAMDRSNLREHVFTNIDSAVIA
jgi:flagellar operon protein